MPKYQVVVGNVGTVCDTYVEGDAQQDYREYVALSRSEFGRASGEQVTFLKDGEIVKEHFPDTMYYGCPDCDGIMVNIGEDTLQCTECSHEACKDMFDRNALLDVAEKCEEALKGFDLSFSEIHKGLKDRLHQTLKIVRG